MKAHVIKDNKIINTIEVKSLDFMPDLVEATEGCKGWGCVDGVLVRPAEPDKRPAIKLREYNSLIERSNTKVRKKANKLLQGTEAQQIEGLILLKTIGE